MLLREQETGKPSHRDGATIFRDLNLHTPTHVSTNLKSAGNDFTQDKVTHNHVLVWPLWESLVVCQQASHCSKDQRCACQTHSSPPVSPFSLQLDIPTFSPPSLFLLISPSLQTDTSIHPLTGIGHCSEHYLIIHVCLCGTV